MSGMTTSAKITYTKDALTNMIDERRTREIAAADADLARRHDPLSLGEKIADWRATQRERVLTLAAAIDDVADTELESFTIPSCPRERAGYGRRTAEEEHKEELEQIDRRYERHVARVVAMQSDEITLTPTALRDWFGL